VEHANESFKKFVLESTSVIIVRLRMKIKIDDGYVECEFTLGNATHYSIASIIGIIVDNSDMFASKGIKAEYPERVVPMDDEDAYHSCGDCGRKLQIVRPGEYHCYHCEKLRVEASNDELLPGSGISD